MRLVKLLGPATLLVMAMAFMPLLTAGTASAAPTTIYADLGRCKTNVDHYQIQLRSDVFSAPASDFPASVALHFANGSSVEARPMLGPNGGTMTYRFADSNGDFVGVAVTGATAQFDTTKYPNYRFTVVARPCLPEPAPTYAVTGDVVQRGNEKPVADLTVCLVEADLCTSTDANGSFAITGVEDGTYTLSTDGENWKPQHNVVTVSGGDVHVNVIQFNGGGMGN